MPFEIAVACGFSASHQLRLSDGTLEPWHSHDWRVQVTVGSQKLDAMGLVMDFHELQKLLEQVIGAVRNRHLNDLPAFASRNPSAENLALHVAESLRLPDGVKLLVVDVWETPDCRASWRA